jgi:N-glycosylase/DNA lyase
MEGGAMNLSAINHTIRALCSEGPMTASLLPAWRCRTEDELFFDVAVCILSSQSLFELAVATADNLKRGGLLAASAYRNWNGHYEEALRFALAKPARLESRGLTRSAIPRFRNRAARLISTTARCIYGEGKTLRQILSAAASPAGARRSLVAAVAGFGPKQASLFLRRIGYCADLAVLDTHILDYLRLAVGISPKPSALSSLSTYEQLELEFRRVAEGFGYSVGCVDLATWVTMRVAKRGSVA